jgi:hypothetical protein
MALIDQRPLPPIKPRCLRRRRSLKPRRESP